MRFVPKEPLVRQERADARNEGNPLSIFSLGFMTAARIGGSLRRFGYFISAPFHWGTP
jgi:hypothetical protein